jgi:hypothetical protein
MIATNVDLGSRPNQINDLVRAGSISDEVAKVPKRIIRLCCGEDGVECFEVPVNVREDERAHAVQWGQTTNFLV